MTEIILKNIYLENADEGLDSYLDPLMEFHLEYQTVSAILHTSSNIMSDPLVRMSELDNKHVKIKLVHDCEIKISGTTVKVTANHFTLTVWSHYGGQEATTIDIPIEAIMGQPFELGHHHHGEWHPFDKEKDLEDFDMDDWEYSLNGEPYEYLP